MFGQGFCLRLTFTATKIKGYNLVRFFEFFFLNNLLMNRAIIYFRVMYPSVRLTESFGFSRSVGNSLYSLLCLILLLLLLFNQYISLYINQPRLSLTHYHYYQYLCPYYCKCRNISLVKFFAFLSRLFFFGGWASFFRK